VLRVPGSNWQRHSTQVPQLAPSGRKSMQGYANELKLLIELEQRHDELLRQLDDLDKRVEAVLAFWTAQREGRREAA